MVKRSPDSPDIVVLPPVLVGGTLIAGLIIHFAVWRVALLPTMVARIVGVTIIVASGIFSLLARRAMLRVGTNVFPTKPSLALATDGPFRRTRNPLYVGAIGGYLGVAISVNAAASLLLAVPMIWILHRGVVLREEQYLARKFGDEYRAYQSRVPRWF